MPDANCTQYIVNQPDERSIRCEGDSVPAGTLSGVGLL